MNEQLEQTREESIQELRAVASEDQLSDWFRATLGKRGAITQAVRLISDLPENERPAELRSAPGHCSAARR